MFIAINQTEKIIFKNNVLILNIKSKFNIIIKRGHNSNLLKILSGVNILLQEARGRCSPFYAIKKLSSGSYYKYKVQIKFGDSHKFLNNSLKIYKTILVNH